MTSAGFPVDAKTRKHKISDLYESSWIGIQRSD